MMSGIGVHKVVPLGVLSTVTHGEERGYNSATMTDAALVRAVLDGDPAAFTTLVDRHMPACLRFAVRMLGNQQDAEDVTQETFVRAFGALGRYNGSVKFQTWLMTILINRSRTALANRRRHDARLVPDDTAIAVAVVASYDDDVVLRDAIGRALASLEPAQREAFLLKHVEQLSYQEMSDMTGVGVSALKMRVQRACERLQALLEEREEGDRP
jgi:RNA polymerase sigma-70 factor (ECF subfamily)